MEHCKKKSRGSITVWVVIFWIILITDAILREFIIHMNYVIEGQGALVNEAGEETPLKQATLPWSTPKGSRK